MTDNSSEERASLHSTIWRIANELRGSVDGWDFKQYVLGLLFYRYISENLCYYLDQKEKATGDSEFSYANLNDSVAEKVKKSICELKGFFIKPSELFENVRRRSASDTNLNETLSIVFKNIEKSALGTRGENDMSGLFDDLNLNSNKLGPTVDTRNKKLTILLDAIGDMNVQIGGGG